MLAFDSQIQGRCFHFPARMLSVPQLPWCLSGKESACQCRRYGFDPGPERSHMPQSNLSWCATTTESMLQSPGVAHAPQSLCSATREATAMRMKLESSSCLPHLEKSLCGNEDPAAARKTQHSQKELAKQNYFLKKEWHVRPCHPRCHTILTSLIVFSCCLLSKLEMKGKC